MPELPEVETLRRALERSLVGRQIADVSIGLSKMFVPWPGWDSSQLVGRSVESLRRRAKFLILDLDHETNLVFHLRLAGQIVHRDRHGVTLAEGGHPVPAFGAPLPHKATHITFRLDDESMLFLTDIRQFGRVWLLPSCEVDPLLARAKLGPEPLSDEFTPDILRQRLAKRARAQLKPLLLDQSFVGGVGNIYADEIAFEALLGPATYAGDLKRVAVTRLYDAIRAVLDRAVTEGVAEILNGKASMERDFPRVHGREGQPCPRCGTTIVKTRFVGRGTYTCPRCQRGPKRKIPVSTRRARTT